LNKKNIQKSKHFLKYFPDILFKYIRSRLKKSAHDYCMAGRKSQKELAARLDYEVSYHHFWCKYKHILNCQRCCPHRPACLFVHFDWLMSHKRNRSVDYLSSLWKIFKLLKINLINVNQLEIESFILSNNAFLFDKTN